jgi:formate hydrogenlyase subunit 6/NADH:ubiquinone oxidoreductase subunit I
MGERVKWQEETLLTEEDASASIPQPTEHETRRRQAVSHRETKITVREDIDALIGALRSRGHRVIGPQVREGAIVYDQLESSADLPAGWADEQSGGSYRLTRGEGEALFGHTVGPQSWKQFLFPPRRRLWSAERVEGELHIVEEEDDSPPLALFGVRPCELRAIQIQDQVLMGQRHADPIYRARREDALIIAVNCTRAGGTCFCASMDAGPHAESGFDLALTEIIDRKGHRFTVEIGSDRGAEIMESVPHREATKEELAEVERIAARVAGEMGRSMETEGIHDLLCNHPEHHRWEEVARRCLSCANCTLVCPTCFCFTVEDTSDLTGDHSERWQQWDSCFNVGFSFLGGGGVRSSVKSRYRQWMTHKLATWIDQFGTTGCVGCGRCITWCPVGIDITEEAAAIRASLAGEIPTTTKRNDEEDRTP